PALADDVARVRDLRLAAEEMKRIEPALFDVFQAGEDGLKRFVDAAARGTLDVADLFKSLGISIVGSLTDAFVEGLKKKAGFEAAFKVNIVQFLGNLGNLIGGQTNGSRPADREHGHRWTGRLPLELQPPDGRSDTAALEPRPRGPRTRGH